MTKLNLYTAEYLSSFIRLREGESKLGEQVHIIADLKELAKHPAPFVLLGIPEDIGVRANYGVGGADSLWSAALSSFLNIQSNAFLSGKELIVLGHIETPALAGKSVDDLRKAVATIDKTVADTIQKIVAAGKTPILIGGGHNNAYGCIKGSSKALKKGINVINVDAHADLRPLEGRHSGNGFSYALEEGFLEKYYVLGLHESYATQGILDTIKSNPNIKAAFFEELFVRDTRSFSDAKKEAIAFVKNSPCGIEIDLDSIQAVLSSAYSPSGFSVNQVRQLLHQFASLLPVHYLHLCEAAVELADGRKDPSMGKLIAYLIADFIKAASKKAQEKE